ncbi:hypothetical protein G9A89_007981 [Geosiphon pyriformis]|nr:hypothetical protein G9A89_007981 [Geosiphon pyriformis]
MPRCEGKGFNKNNHPNKGSSNRAINLIFRYQYTFDFNKKMSINSNEITITHETFKLSSKESQESGLENVEFESEKNFMVDRDLSRFPTPTYDLTKYIDLAHKLNKNPSSYLERYFEKSYFLDPDDLKREDYYMYSPPNGLIVFGLAPSHPILKDHIDPLGSFFPFSLKSDSTLTEPIIIFNEDVINRFRQKKVKFSIKDELCKIRIEKTSSSLETIEIGELTENERFLEGIGDKKKEKEFQEYSIKFPLKGALMNWNQRLRGEPDILFRKPFTEGYLGIIAPDKKKLPDQKNWRVEAEYKFARFGIPPP